MNANMYSMLRGEYLNPEPEDTLLRMHYGNCDKPNCVRRRRNNARICSCIQTRCKHMQSQPSTAEETVENNQSIDQSTS